MADAEPSNFFPRGRNPERWSYQVPVEDEDGFASTIAIENMWPAALLSSLAFGLAHAYQGPKGVLKTGLFGLAAAGLYLLIGSIWLLIVLHAVVDLVSGTIGREVLAD